VKSARVAKNSPYLPKIAALVDTARRASAGENWEHIISDEFDRARIHLFGKGLNRGEFHIGFLQKSLNIYMSALLSVCSPNGRQDLTDFMITFNQRITDFINVGRINAITKASGRSLALSEIVHGALNTSNTDSAILNMLQGISDAGCEMAYLLLFKEPMVADGPKVVLPEVILVSGAIVDGQVTAFGKHAPELPVGQAWTLVRNEQESHVYSAIGLFDSNQLLGYFAAQTDDLPFSQFHLISVQITYALRHVQIIREKQRLIAILGESNIQLRQEFLNDPLSGLLNRRGLMGKLDERFSAPPTKTGALFYLDLDRFKEINDTYGHDVGDDAIKQTANILRASLRNDDLIARMGGDEFVFFVSVRDATEAVIIKKRVERNIENFNETTDAPYRLYASIGICTFEMTDDVDIGQIVSEADAELYRIKQLRHAQMDAEAKADRT